MKRQLFVYAAVIVCFSLFCSSPILDDGFRVQAKEASDDQKITVLTPMGTPPPVDLKPMARRLGTLEGKTIYVVDQGYLGTDNLLKEMILWLEGKYPNTEFIFERLGRNSGPEPPALFKEIGEKADGVIMGLGH